MSFDIVYKEIGDLGLYQIYVLALGWMTAIYGGFIFINSVFLLYVPDHRCAIPGYDNDSFTVRNEAHQMLINTSIPPSSDEPGGYDKCHLYFAENNITREGSNSTMTHCNSWVYDTSVFTLTLGAKLNLVCDRAMLKSTAQMIFFSGLLVGSLVSGIISDRFGRKPTLCTSIMLYTATGLSIAWSPSIEVYMVLSACLGFFSVGMFMPVFVVGMEFVGPSRRLYAGQIIIFFWAFGTLIMTGFAYIIRHWFFFQIVCATPGVAFISYWILYPESPRWLYIQGKQRKMKKLILRAAKVNKVKLSEDFFETLPRPKEEESEVGFHKLFSHRVLAMRTVIIYLNWIAVCMAYYGLALNSDGLGGDSGIHLFFFLQTLMDIPGGLIVLLLVDITGRKPVLVCSMLIGGVACIATMFTTMYGGEGTAVATLVLALIGKIGASAGFHMVYQYSAEIFPTVVRNAGMGSSSCMARIGGIIAPLVADLNQALWIPNTAAIFRNKSFICCLFYILKTLLKISSQEPIILFAMDRLVSGKFGKALPLLVFGSLSAIAGLMALLLPETLKRDLPETIQDGITFGRSNVNTAENQTRTMALLNDVDCTKYRNETDCKKENNSTV